MSRLMRRPRLLLVAVFLLGALLAGSGVVVAAQVTKNGRAVTAVKVVTETSYRQIVTDHLQEGTWADIPGMSLGITVPSGEKALLLITFSAQTFCAKTAGEYQTTFCHVQVLVDGNPAHPGDVTFDSANDGITWEANSMQFVAGPLNAGSHTVKVQGMPNELSSFFSFEHRTLSVLRSRV